LPLNVSTRSQASLKRTGPEHQSKVGSSPVIDWPMFHCPHNPGRHTVVSHESHNHFDKLLFPAPLVILTQSRHWTWKKTVGPLLSAISVGTGASKEPTS